MRLSLLVLLLLLLWGAAVLPGPPSVLLRGAVLLVWTEGFVLLMGSIAVEVVGG